MSTLKILSDINCTVRCDFKEVGNIQAGELYKLQLKKGCYILEFLVEDIVICSMDYTIETNDEEPLLRLNIKEQAEKKIREQKYIQNKSAKVNINIDNNRVILDNEANIPVVLPKEFILYYQSEEGHYTEDEAGLIPFYVIVMEEKIKNGETYQIEKNLYGSLNKLGEIVIKPIYTTPVVFYNDVIAKTTRNKTLYYLNHYGEEIGLSYLNTDAFTINKPLDKNCNLFIAQSTEDESLWGVVRFDKKIIVSISNKTIYENTDNYVWVLKDDTLSIYDNEGKWIKSIQHVDLGEIDLPCRRKQQDYIFVHKEAVAVRVLGYWGLYDFKGNVLIPHIYKLLDAYWVYSDYDYESGKEFLTGDGYGSSPLMFVKKMNGGYGIININVLDESYGIRDVNDIKEIIPCKYDAIYSNDGKRIEELMENFFQWDEQGDNGNGGLVHGIGDDIFFVKYYDGLMECDYFCTQMLRFGKKDKEEHFVCKELFNENHYIDEDGNPHLRGKQGNQRFFDKEKLINTSRNALVYSEDGLSIIGCDETFEGDLIVPEGIEHIVEYAFDRCKLTSIYIPISLKSIDNWAFPDCSTLTSVHISDIVAWCKIVFGDTYSNPLLFAHHLCLEEVEITDLAIPNSVTSIGNRTFVCSELTSVTIPNSVTSIGDYAFSGCSELTSVTIPNSVTSIGNWAFSYCSSLTSVIIPNSVTSIGYSAFRCCRSLTSIIIPNSVMSIGDGVFRDCDNLKEIIIPKGTKAKFEELLPDQKDKLVEQEEMTNNETMNRIIYFDTETTGVPLNYKAPSSDTNNWPRLVQLAWILTDEEGNRIHTGNLIVKPDGFVIPADATKVHGISTQRAKEEGVPLAEAIEQFMADLNVATFIVGHNIEFDKKIVGAEMIRLGMKDELEKKKSYCTMQSSIDFCKIPGKYGFKYPKLQELYRKLFDRDFEDAHNAMSDIEATEKCFWELLKRKLVILE